MKGLLFPKRLLITCISLCLLIYTCSSPSASGNLTPLSWEETLERKLNNNLDLNSAIILGRSEEAISTPELDSLTQELVGLDYFTGPTDKLVKVKIRDRHYRDNLFNAIVRSYDASLISADSLPEINCARLAEEIELSFQIIPGYRYDTLLIDEYNYYNIRTKRTAAIYSNCTAEQISALDNKPRRKLWLEYQHASHELMATLYYPLVHEAFKRRNFSDQLRALSVDRLLMSGGYPQIYGSQLMNGVLWPIADTTKLDSIRTSMGMKPMKEYLEYFGVEY